MIRGGLLLYLAVLSFSGAAEAGPWTREKGKGYTQAAVLAQRIDGQTAVRGELYGEYGVTSKWTLNGQLEGVTFTELDGFDQFAYRLTGRRQLWQQGIWKFAFEGGLVGGEAIGGTIGGCDTIGGEARLSFGGGGRTEKGRDWFAFIDGVIREHGNCRRQRIEAGYGREIVKNWFTTSKVFFEEGTDDARSVKVETVLSRRFGKTDLSLGYRQELGGRFQESGIIFSLERRF